MKPGRTLLRARDGKEARVSFVELFFDLIYVFAVTQLSYRLLEDLSLTNGLETLVLRFAVWLGLAIHPVGNALYKKVVYGRFPPSHLAGLEALAVLTPVSYATDQG